MKRFTFVPILIGLCCNVIVFAQQLPAEKLFEIKGSAKNQDNISLAGLNLFLEGGELKKTIITDENGAFAVKLPVGKYKVMANAAVSKNFVAYIETFDNNLNATNFDLIVETDEFCCDLMSNGNPTEVVKYIAPPYPAAARAVRAIGEVIVAVEIDKEGKVISSKVEFGHPLLRAASDQAAKQWLFSSDESAGKREGKIIFSFVQPDKERDNSLINPNRLVIFARALVIDSTGTH